MSKSTSHAPKSEPSAPTTAHAEPIDSPDSPSTFPMLAGLSAIFYFPPQSIPITTVLLLSTSAFWTWFLLLHPYLPSSYTRTYSHLLTNGALLLLSLILTLCIGASMIPAWWAGEAKHSGHDSKDWVNSPADVAILADMTAQAIFSVKLVYYTWIKPKLEKKSED